MGRSYRLFVLLAATAIAVLALLFIAADAPVSQGTDGNAATSQKSPPNAGSNAPVPVQPRGVGNVFFNLPQAAVAILNGLPSGKTVQAADFRAKFGKEADDILRALDVTSVSRSRDRITLVRKAPTVDDVAGYQLHFAQRISFDARQTPTSVDLTDVSGVAVDVSMALPNLDMESASFTKDGNGNTVITMDLEVSRFLPNITRTITIAPDGQVVGGP